MFQFIVAFITIFIFLFLLPSIQELSRLSLIIGVFDRVSKMDADYDVSLDFPLDLDEDVTLCLQTIVSVMNYVTIWITRDIINFLSLYTIMYTFFVGLLCP